MSESSIAPVPNRIESAKEPDNTQYQDPEKAGESGLSVLLRKMSPKEALKKLAARLGSKDTRRKVVAGAVRAAVITGSLADDGAALAAKMAGDSAGNQEIAGLPHRVDFYKGARDLKSVADVRSGSSPPPEEAEQQQTIHKQHHLNRNRMRPPDSRPAYGVSSATAAKKSINLPQGFSYKR